MAVEIATKSTIEIDDVVEAESGFAIVISAAIP
jgi:hypothetical protein